MSGRFAKSFGISRGWASATAQPVVGAAEFALSNATVTTGWMRVVVGELLPSDAPPGAYFVLVNEPAGFAVENG